MAAHAGSLTHIRKGAQMRFSFLRSVAAWNRRDGTESTARSFSAEQPSSLFAPSFLFSLTACVRASPGRGPPQPNLNSFKGRISLAEAERSISLCDEHRYGQTRMRTGSSLCFVP